MTLHVTYCSKNKDRSRKNLPAIERYQSDRIDKISSRVKDKEGDFAILSGKYGLLKPDDEIPYYDQLLREKDVPSLMNEVVNFLKTRDINHVIYYTREVKGSRVPYFNLIKTSCTTLGIDFEKRIITQDA